MNLDVIEKFNQILNNIRPSERNLIERSLTPFVSNPDAFEIIVRLLEGLNSEQLEVVAYPFDGPPTLVLGGAGSGKTSTLTRRLAFLVLAGISPERIFAVTFTRKAAREMTERTRQLFYYLRDSASEPYRTWLNNISMELENAWITTFHSAGLRILRDDPFGIGVNLLLIGKGAHSRIINEEERNLILKNLVKSYGNEEVSVEEIGSLISNAKGAFVYPEGFHYIVRTRIEEIAALVYPEYQAELDRRSLLDFDDLIFKVYELFEKHPEILEHYQDRFQTLLIDEYQDINLSQYLIGMMLAKKHRKIMAVGDDDQSIYGWRGAEVTNLTRFMADYPDVRLTKLVRNYRSDATILKAANSIWKDKPEELRKVLICSKADGNRNSEPIRIISAENEDEEARFIATEIIDLLGQSFPLNEIALLVRSHYLLAPIVAVLEEFDIPWVQAGSIKSLARPEVLAIVSIMEVIALTARRISVPGEWHTGDLEAINHALMQAITSPSYNCPSELLEDLLQLPDPSSLLLDDTARAQSSQVFDKRLSYTIDHISSIVKSSMSNSSICRPTALFDYIFKLANPLDNDDTESPSWRALRRMRELAEIASVRRTNQPFESILQFTEETRARAGLLPDEGESTETDSNSKPAVQLMTLHAAKGLEFEVVFLSAMEDGIIPVRRRKDDRKTDDLEFRYGEEKRLFYVGVSRARKRLYITMSRKRKNEYLERESKPSPFIELIPSELTEKKKI